MDIKLIDERGFTLIEMILVVLLLATLASLASLTLSGIHEETIKDLAEVDLKMIRQAARSYYMENKHFPSSINDLTNYLEEIPDDKFLDGSGTKYSLISSESSCTLRSVGPDRKADTSDDLIFSFNP